jgi:hypothetical protein
MPPFSNLFFICLINPGRLQVDGIWGQLKLPDALTGKNEASVVKKTFLNLERKTEMFLRYYS